MRTARDASSETAATTISLIGYEEVCLKAYESIPEAREELAAYFDLYNQRRRHQGLKNRTPDEVYWATLQTEQTAA